MLRCSLLVMVAAGTAYAENPPITVVAHPRIAKTHVPAHDMTATALDAKHPAPPGFADGLKHTLEDVDTLVASAEFLDALASVEHADATPNAKTPATGLDIEAAMFGPDSIMLPVHFLVAPDDNHKGDPAVTGFTTKVATITLLKNAVPRIVATDEGSRACSMNTIVHEFIHTIPVETGSRTFRFMDGKKTAKRALASYVIGGVAQCTYLARAHAIALSASELAACIQATGTTIFVAHCETGWFESFIKQLRAH